MRIIPILGIVLPFLGGCAVQTVYKDVLVPVNVPCVREADLPKPVVTIPDHELKGLDDYSFVLTLAQERLALISHSGELHAVLKGCIQP